MNPEARFSGHWIVAAQGTGKTNLLLHMLASDLQKDVSIVVLDSKGELTGAIRNLALGDRLIVFDPDEPFAINPFDVRKGDHLVSQLAYMLSGLLETNITAKQRTFFETIVEALLYFPAPTMTLLWDIIAKGPKLHFDQISQLPEDIQSFFKYEWDGYNDTSREMQWRLRGLMGKNPFKTMFKAPKTRFRIGDAMDFGKVVVIDNSQAKCGAENCGFLGRFFVAQIWAAGTSRALLPEHKKKPTYVYIDEAHLVIKKDQKIAAIIDELRSQKVALVMAHQKVRAQIEDTNVLSSLENCAIKMVNVGKGETDYFSKLLDIPEERLKGLPRGHFATDIRWEGTSIQTVPKAKLPFRTMTEAEQTAHKERMRELYGYKSEDQNPTKRHDAFEPAADPGEGPDHSQDIAERPQPKRDPSKPAKWTPPNE